VDIIHDPSRNPTVWLDSEAAVKIAVFDDDQWIAYDDAETLQMKLDFANSECIGGYAIFLEMNCFYMISSLILIVHDSTAAWAVDEDGKGDLAGMIISDLPPGAIMTNVL
jgi:hypothetical protein